MTRQTGPGDTNKDGTDKEARGSCLRTDPAFLTGDRCGGRSTRLGAAEVAERPGRRRGGMRAETYENLACHSGNEAPKIQHFYFPLLLLSLTRLPSRYLHWLLHDHRSHPASVTINERPALLRARLGEDLTAEHTVVLSATTLSSVCIKISQESIFASILLKRATASLGSKGRQSRLPRRDVQGVSPSDPAAIGSAASDAAANPPPSRDSWPGAEKGPRPKLT